jgi:glycosyltransferase involved in cell wall biosynthesis
MEPDALFAQIDVLVVPSQSPETGPFVIYEAFARGIPVVGAAIGGIPEIVTHGRTGLLFAPGDAVGLKRRIDELAGERTRLASLSDACLAWAASHSTQVFTKVHLDVYGVLLRQSRPPLLQDRNDVA